MTKRRKTRPIAASPALPGSPPSPAVLHVLTAIAALLCLALGWLSRNALNPDGVSYLDLAAAMQRGDWPHFVQGYWSPLYPALIAALAALPRWHGTALVALTHAINTAAALGGLGILWWWGRRQRDPWAGRAAIAAFLICSAGVPRIEAVTPDLVLLLIAIWWSYELLVHRASHWLLTGLLLGATFLAKTSSWPWLLVALPMLWWCGSDAAARRRAIQSAIACAAVMLLWVVPMSLKYGHPTLGSSGTLNYSWYITTNTSRLPDGDRGTNRSYQSIAMPGPDSLRLAVFDEEAYWTYQPWGDPTAWRDQVTSETGRAPGVDELVRYWIRVGALVFGLWMLPTILTVMAPAYLLHRRPRMWHELVTARRAELTVSVLGLVGLLQFTAIHAEPRLLAPFGMMLALGTIAWCCAAPPGPAAVLPRMPREILAWIGLAGALVFAIPKFIDGFKGNARLIRATAQLDTLRFRAASAGIPLDRIGIVGPAAPILSAAYWVGGHISAQVPAAFAARLDGLPESDQSSLLRSVFAGRASVIWQTNTDGGMRILFLQPRKP